MNEARFSSIHRGLSTVAQKVYAAMPIADELSIKAVRWELIRSKGGHTIAVKPSMGRTQTIQLRGDMLYGYSDPRNPDGKTLGY